MTGMTRFFIALATTAVSLCTPLAAQTPPPAAAQAAARINIPFNPPLDRPLRYRATITKTQAEGPNTVWIDYEITFSRRPEGFRMQVRTVDAGAPDLPQANASMVRRMMVDLAPPYVLLLNAGAAIEGMEDEEAYWNRMLALTEQTLRQQGGQAASDPALSTAMTMMRQTSPEARLQMMTQYVSPLLAFANTEFVIGEARTSEDQFEGPMGLTLRQHSSVTAERVENGRLILTMLANVPEEEMRRALSTFLVNVPTVQGANGHAARDQVAAELRNGHFDRQGQGSYEIALESGLVHRFEGTDRMQLEIGGERRIRQQAFRLERRD
jgi:hypothetical protein